MRARPTAPDPGDPPARGRTAPIIAFDDALHGPQAQDVAREVGDFVLKRADGFWAYQLAVVVDDAAQGITDVVRGADLLDSTPRQILLQRALACRPRATRTCRWWSIAHGRKLSKSDAALPVDPGDPLPALRAAWSALGQPPDALADARGSVGDCSTVRAGPPSSRRTIPRTGRLDPAAMHNRDFTKRT